MTILSLPCVKTIRSYLSLVSTKCGFDDKYLELFKKSLSLKETVQKHRVPLFDEIHLQEALHVITSSLTYQGLIDYGDQKKAKIVNETAKTALVGMFQPLADTYMQPFCVFASSTAVHGTDLDKIVMTFVINLEAAGAIVHGIITDGAETNRNMWKEFGISGKLCNTVNSCEHPADENRRLFFFSDTPHLIKNIRHRLLEKKLRVSSFILHFLSTAIS